MGPVLHGPRLRAAEAPPGWPATGGGPAQAAPSGRRAGPRPHHLVRRTGRLAPAVWPVRRMEPIRCSGGASSMLPTRPCPLHGSRAPRLAKLITRPRSSQASRQSSLRRRAPSQLTIPSATGGGGSRPRHPGPHTAVRSAVARDPNELPPAGPDTKRPAGVAVTGVPALGTGADLPIGIVLAPVLALTGPVVQQPDPGRSERARVSVPEVHGNAVSPWRRRARTIRRRVAVDFTLPGGLPAAIRDGDGTPL